MKRIKRRCKCCGCLFVVCNKVKKHEYCKKTKCQKARRKKWQRKKIQNDTIYRNDQKAAQKDWSNTNPEYWKKYRDAHPEYTDRNRQKQRKRNRRRKNRTISKPIAKMDALKQKNNIISGKYELIPVRSDMIAKMDAIIVEITTISNGYANFGP